MKIKNLKKIEFYSGRLVCVLWFFVTFGLIYLGAIINNPIMVLIGLISMGIFWNIDLLRGEAYKI